MRHQSEEARANHGAMFPFAMRSINNLDRPVLYIRLEFSVNQYTEPPSALIDPVRIEPNWAKFVG